MKRLVFVLCALAMVASVAFADIPKPENCYCTTDPQNRILMIPGHVPPRGTGALIPSPFASFTCTIRNTSNAVIPNAVTEVLIGNLNVTTVLCADAVTTGTTNGSGIVSFNIQGGGCYKGVGSDAAVIVSNGTPIRRYDNVMSPDYTQTDNAGIQGNYDNNVGLTDFSRFAQALNAGVASCHDYDNSGTTGLGDFAVFAACLDRWCP